MTYNHTLTKITLTLLVIFSLLVVGSLFERLFVSADYIHKVDEEIASRGLENGYLYKEYKRCLISLEHNACLDKIKTIASDKNIPLIYQYVSRDIEKSYSLMCRIKVNFFNKRCIDKAEVGFQNERFQFYQSQLRQHYTNYSQFCINGAAFILSKQESYSNQYKNDFGYCMKSLLKHYKDSTPHVSISHEYKGKDTWGYFIQLNG